MGRPRTCSCGECQKCKRREYMRAWYQKTKKTYVNLEKRRAYDRWRYQNDEEYRTRHKARMALAQQVRRGIQKRGPCGCGNAAVEMHHPDYQEPLRGIPVCKECHMKIHNENQEGE